MSERFVNVSALPCPLAAVGSPVMLIQAQLLWDTQEGNYVVRLGMKNVSFQTLRGITLQLTLQDQLGATLEGVYEQPFGGLLVAPEAEFEEMMALADPGAALGGFTVDVTRAGFDNGEFAVRCGAWAPADPVETQTAPARDGQNSLDPGAAAYVPESQRPAAPEQTYAPPAQQTYAPPVQQTYAPPAPAAKPKKKKGKAVLIVFLVIVLAVAAFAGVYWSSYQSAKELAEDWKFEKAQDKLFLPDLTAMHDPGLVDFVKAGVFIEEGDYASADWLLYGLDYPGAEELAKERRYREAEAQLERGEYSAAMLNFQILADQDYSDADERYNEARLGYALARMEAGDRGVLTGFQDLLALAEEGYAPAKAELPNAQKTLYASAQELYRNGEYITANSYFVLIPDYSDSQKYQDLILAQHYGLTLEELWDLRGFEDADDVLLSQYYLSEFLMGTWETGDGSYYFTMYSDYSTAYNLPYYEGPQYYIEDGVFVLEQNNGTTKNMYRFTIVNWNQITVYCFKDGSTHTLYRQ